MAILNVNGIEYQGKCNFAFDQTADEKYNESDASGNKLGGFVSIYMKLLGDDLKGLLAFWDSACTNYGKKSPSKKEIENVLMEIIDDEENGEEQVEQLFKDAFKAIHNSGFYRKQKNKLWEQFEKFEARAETEEEKEKAQADYKELLETRDKLLA